MTTFKKYKNRKFYNFTTKKYSTLSEIFQIATREPIVVVDGVTRKDITAETLVKGALESLDTNGLKKLAEAGLTIFQFNAMIHQNNLETAIAADLEKNVPKSTPVSSEELKVIEEVERSRNLNELEDLFSGSNN